MTSRNYCFTLNNPTEQLDFDIEFIKYAIYQEEQKECYHFQGYVELTKPMRIAQVKELNNGMLEKAHLECRRGTAKQAIDYCRKKDETFLAGPYEFGETKVQGHRSDIKEFTEAIKANKNNKELCEQFPGAYLRFSKMVPTIRSMYKPKDKPRTAEEFNRPFEEIPKDRCLLFAGPPSIGKTQYALAHFKNPLKVDHIDQLHQLDNDIYDGIVIDDLSFKMCSAEYRIKLLECRTDSAIHCRYGHIELPKNIPRIFTHNHDDIFYGEKDSDVQTTAIDSRFKLVHLDEPLFD